MEQFNTGDVCMQCGGFYYRVCGQTFLPRRTFWYSNNNNNNYSDKHTLTTSASTAVTHIDVKEQPLLHTCRERVSCCPLCLILGCVSAPIPHTAFLLSLHRHNHWRDQWLVLGNGGMGTVLDMGPPEASEATWTSFQRGPWEMDLGVAVHNGLRS